MKKLIYLSLLLLFFGCKKEPMEYSVEFRIEGNGSPFQCTYKNEAGATITPVNAANNWQGLKDGWTYTFTAKENDVLYFKAFKGTSADMTAIIKVNGEIVKQGKCNGQCEQELTHEL